MTNQVLCSIIAAIFTNWVDVPHTDPGVECAMFYRDRLLIVECEGKRFTNILERVHVDHVEFRVKRIEPTGFSLLSSPQTIQPVLPEIKP